MTTYEIIATVIAGLALAQPWLIKLFIRWFRKIKIAFIPSSKLKLYYNKSGSYISIGGVIESKNQPAVIKNISWLPAYTGQHPHKYQTVPGSVDVYCL